MQRACDPERVEQQGLGLVHEPLIGENLADVQRCQRNVPAVAHLVPCVSGAPVQIERIVPPALKVREDAHVVEDETLPMKIAELLVDAQGQGRVDRLLVAPERRIAPVEQEVGVGQRVTGVGSLRLLDGEQSTT